MDVHRVKEKPNVGGSCQGPRTGTRHLPLSFKEQSRDSSLVTSGCRSVWGTCAGPWGNEGYTPSIFFSGSQSLEADFCLCENDEEMQIQKG